VTSKKRRVVKEPSVWVVEWMYDPTRFRAPTAHRSLQLAEEEFASLDEMDAGNDYEIREYRRVPKKPKLRAYRAKA
jgi:hypothetical protein